MRLHQLRRAGFRNPAGFATFRTELNSGQLAAYRNVAIVAATLMTLSALGAPITVYAATSLTVIAAALLTWRNVSTAKVHITHTGVTAADTHRNGRPVTLPWGEIQTVSIQTYDFGIAYLARLDGAPDLANGGAGHLLDRANLLSGESDDNPLDRLQFVILDTRTRGDVWIKTSDPEVPRAILRALSWWHAEYGTTQP